MANVSNDDAHHDATSKSNARPRKESRRPDIAIYKPGQSRIGKRSEDDTPKPSHNTDENISTKNIHDDRHVKEYSKKQTQPSKVTPHGDRGHTSKQHAAEWQRQVREREDEKSSSGHHRDRKSASREHRSHRDDRKHPDRRSERPSASGRASHNSKPRPEQNSNSGHGHHAKSTTKNEGRQTSSTSQSDQSLEEKPRQEASREIKTESKSVDRVQQPHRENRWHGPQGKRKNNTQPATEVKAGSEAVAERTSGQSGNREVESSNTDQSKMLDRGHKWSGRQEYRHNGAGKDSRSDDKSSSSHRHGNGRHDNHSSRHHRSHGENVPNRSNAKSSEAHFDKPGKQRKPERSFYVSPKLACGDSSIKEVQPCASDPQEGDSGKYKGPVPAEDAVETMVFTSRKPTNQSQPQKCKPGDSQSEKFTLEKNKKVPLKSLLDLQVSPPTEVTSPLPLQTEPRSQTETNSQSSEMRTKAVHPSKRYSAKRSRQRYNSGSSTGSDNSQFVDATAVKSGDPDRELTEADSRLKTLSLKKDVADSRDSVSSSDSSKYSGTTASQKNRSQNQNLKKQLHSRKEAEDSSRVSDVKEPRKHYSERGKLSVTFDSQVREVKISPEDERQALIDEELEDEMHEDRSQKNNQVEEQNRHPGRESRRSSSESEQTQGSRSGGLLRFPQKKSDPVPIHSQSANQQLHPDHTYQPIYDKYYTPPPQAKDDPRPKDPRGRHGNRNLLWDPSKPQEKPALATSKKVETTSDLLFYDPECDGSPKDHGFDHRGQFVPPGYGYYPAGQQMMQVPVSGQPSYGFPQPMSWAEQVEAHSADSQIQTRSAPVQIPNYQGNFPPLGVSPDSLPLPSSVGSVSHPQAASASVAVRILQDSVRYEHSLNNAVSRRFHGDESVQKIMKLSQDLERMYEQVIVTDLETCNKHNVEQLLWKSAYYQLIESLRRQESEEPGLYKTHLDNLLIHGNDFYVGLLEKIQTAYNFRLETHTGLDPLHEEPRRTIKLALLSAQRCMISLGDIARYKELTNETNNYGKARSWYLKAQHLAPRNGRPYNQLAILALYTRRKLDAVYYYMRSLAASNPFLTARESLMSLFEEVRRKAEHKENAQIQAKLEKEKAREIERRSQAKERGGRRGRRDGRKDDSQATRREIWIASDGSSHDGSELVDNVEEDEEEALKRISPVEINKRFVLSLLNVHGKLFTKIGMENFEFITDRLLKEFKVLLTHSPTPITSTRLIQAMAVNMFAAHNTGTQDQSPREDMRTLIQEQSIQLGLDMFGLLVSRCNQLLTDHLKTATNDRVLLSEDLLELLPGVKVYADWLMCHPRLWNPPPCCTNTPYSATVDVWACLAELLNTLKRIDLSIVQFVKKTDENECQEILLPEDVQLSGFVPLLSLPLQPVYVPMDTNKLEAMDCVRIISLLLFGEYACGQETPLMAYNVCKNCYISIAPEPINVQEVTHVPGQDDDDVIIEEEYYENEADSTGDEVEDSGGIGGLRQKKEDLERRLLEQQQKQAHIQAAMETHRQQRGLEVQISPVYLVPDTNCFIDHLDKIQALLSCRKYKLVVPLVVINELDGLAKGSKDSQFEDLEQSRKVQVCAESSVRCLEEKFEQRHKSLRALTSKGTVMDTIAYRSEEVDFKGCNDDLILKCCLHYVDDRARDFMPTQKDAPIRLFRDVVLLTNDRNLRVKALQQNVPVKDITAFTKWAKV